MRRSKKNIFVTGGSGFIGTHLVTSLLSLGFSVTIYDKVISTEYPDLSIKGDIRDRKGLTESLAGHDIVIHLAAEH